MVRAGVIRHIGNWVEDVLKKGSNQREVKWTQSIAVSDKALVMKTTSKLGAKAIGRRGIKNNEGNDLGGS